MFPKGTSFVQLFFEQFSARVGAVATYSWSALLSAPGARGLLAVLLASVFMPQVWAREELRLPTLALALAMLGVHVVYIGSYQNLDWHLEHSYNRVMFQLVPAACLWFALLVQAFARTSEISSSSETTLAASALTL
jgi:uncharacterized membrane protein